MEIEGILLNKIQVKESDLIIKLLLRNGKIVSLYIYGGKGGGKKKKGSIFELGCLIKTNIDLRRKSSTQNIFIAKESTIEWRHEKISQNFIAYYLLCFFLEAISKVGIEEHHDFDLEGEEKLFAIGSNIVFHLDRYATELSSLRFSFLFIFLQRVTDYLGLLPNLDHCLVCDEPIERKDTVSLSFQDGAFTHYNCAEGKRSPKGREVRSSLIDSARLPLANVSELEGVDKDMCEQLFLYLCHQIELRPEQMKTWHPLQGVI